MKTTETYRVRLVSGKELTIKSDRVEFGQSQVDFYDKGSTVAQFSRQSLEGYWLEKNAGESAES